MQYLLISRHGNTFAPTDKVVWVGANNDLPLVESGNNQATVLAQTLDEAGLIPQVIHTGPLKRTFCHAQIIRDKLSKNIPIQIDNRLREIDYGKWSGLTDQEIKEQFGDEELDHWRNNGIWPASFNGSEQETIDAVLSFADDTVIKQPDRKLTLAITSNGCIKYFLKLLANEENNLVGKWKVATGQVSLLAFSKSTWELMAWNESPHFVCNILKAKIKALAGIA
jgi:broad specificity phosphatase PhoE